MAPSNSSNVRMYCSTYFSEHIGDRENNTTLIEGLPVYILDCLDRIDHGVVSWLGAGADHSHVQQSADRSVKAVISMIAARPILIRSKKAANYKIPDFQERDDGYDGHLEWTLSDHNLVLMAKFRNAVFAKDFEKVKSMVESLYSSFQNDSQVDHLCALICDRSSVEPLKEALLTAICIGSRPLVEFILALFHEYPGEERSGCINSTSFMPHMTPLMMACICNNFAIVECLLMRNHSIDLPHCADCVCEMCYSTTRTVGNTIQPLDTYRAISSEAFLWLATADPLLAAIQLSGDLIKCQSVLTQHKDIFEKLNESVQNFAASLVEECWNMEEVDVLLRQPDGATLSDSHIPYPRARLALDGHMKKFSAHMNVQVAMQNKWYGGWRDFGTSVKRDAGRLLKHSLLMPIFAFLHAISAGRLVKTFNYPIARYISFTTSYLSFLGALLTARMLNIYSSDGPSDRTLLSNKVLFYTQAYMMLYVLGLILWEFLEFSRRGMERYFEMWWRWFDMIMLVLFTCAVMCWASTYTVVASDGLAMIHRKHWIEYDVYLIYDIFYAGGCIMALWRIFYFVQLQRFIGSTVISIGRCVSQIYYYLLIMAVVLMCFSIGVNTILFPYTQNQFIKPDNGVLTPNSDQFFDWYISMRTLYWAFYGYLHPNDYNPVVGHAGPDGSQTHHRVTRNAAEWMCAIYYIVTIVTLLNLMISLLVKTATNVLENEDCEWKYTRLHIYYEYCEHSAAVPPPFNLIFILSSMVYRLISKDYIMIFPDLFVQKQWVTNTDVSLENRYAYRDLIMRLFQRYRASKEVHFKSMQRYELDKEKKRPLLKLAFMNAPHNSNTAGELVHRKSQFAKQAEN
uniref:ANK_REP_REGION domain-containing protein n=1 Tax=Steinernema glaseri TaxID=37863 RepID=A0A1I7YP55_9BILA